jgi:hypothetical protein
MDTTHRQTLDRDCYFSIGLGCLMKWHSAELMGFLMGDTGFEPVASCL